MGKFIVIVLDGFGIGAMQDTRILRKEDQVANTAMSILKSNPMIHWPNLERLGLMNVLGFETEHMKYASSALYGKCNLMHTGADTFLGHQEIMGTKPQEPVQICFQDVLDEVKEILLQHDYHIETIQQGTLSYFLVNGCVAIGDNIDSDPGQAINCIGALDMIQFDELLTIGNLVRSVVTCNRVIVFGGTQVSIQKIVEAQEVKENRYIGNVAVKTGVYEHGYQVRHLGYGVDERVQVPYLLGKHGIPVTLIGKVADVCQNTFGKSINCVDSDEVMNLVIQEMSHMDDGFICANIQETDLAGHSMNAAWYENILSIVDRKLSDVIMHLEDEDLLLICADHGNDPLIGHNHHTREQVPILIYGKYVSKGNLKERSTLSDIGATVCDYFNIEPCENGRSILLDTLENA